MVRTMYSFKELAESIPLSKATILAGAIMNICLIINRRRKDVKNTLMIDYGMAAASIPLLLAGTMIGVMQTKMLPPILIVILLSCYLIISGYKMAIKARQETIKENKAWERRDMRSNELESKKSSSEANNKLLENDNEQKHDKMEGSEHIDEKTLDDNNVNTKQLEDSPKNKNKSGLRRMDTVNHAESTDRAKFCTLFKYVVVDVVMCLIAYFIILMVALQRGGHGADSIIGIEFCSTPGWILFAFGNIGCLACALFVVFRNRNSQLNPNNPLQNPPTDENVPQPILKPEDPEYTIKKKKLKSKIAQLLVAAYGAGIGAGTLGIGGGMIINPVLQSMGVNTEVAAAVAGFSVQFTASSTTTQFAIAGAININQAFIFLIFSAVGSLVGNFVILRIVDKYKRPSLLIWILLGILSASCCVLPAMGIYKAVEAGNIWKFDTPC